MTFDVTFDALIDISRSSSNTNDTGEILRSENERCSFPLRRTAFLVVCQVLCAKMVRATSNWGFLFHSFIISNTAAINFRVLRRKKPTEKLPVKVKSVMQFHGSDKWLGVNVRFSEMSALLIATSRSDWPVSGRIVSCAVSVGVIIGTEDLSYSSMPLQSLCTTVTILSGWPTVAPGLQ